MQPGFGSETELLDFLLHCVRKTSPGCGGWKSGSGDRGRRVQPGHLHGSRAARGAQVKGYTCWGGSPRAGPRDARAQ